MANGIKVDPSEVEFTQPAAPQAMQIDPSEVEFVSRDVDGKTITYADVMREAAATGADPEVMWQALQGGIPAVSKTPPLTGDLRDAPVIGPLVQGGELAAAGFVSGVSRLTGAGDADRMQRGIAQYREQAQATSPGAINTGIRTIAEGAAIGLPAVSMGPVGGALYGAAAFGTTAADRAIYEGRQAGLEGDELRNYVAAQGAVGAGFGAVPGAGVVGKATGRAVGRAVARGAAAGAGESLAETGVRTAFDVNAPETWGGVAEEALLSAAMGGAFVLPAGVRKGLQEGKVKAREMAKRRIAEQVKADKAAADEAARIVGTTIQPGEFVPKPYRPYEALDGGTLDILADSFKRSGDMEGRAVVDAELRLRKDKQAARTLEENHPVFELQGNMAPSAIQGIAENRRATNVSGMRDVYADAPVPEGLRPYASIDDTTLMTLADALRRTGDVAGQREAIREIRLRQQRYGQDLVPEVQAQVVEAEALRRQQGQQEAQGQAYPQAPVNPRIQGTPLLPGPPNDITAQGLNPSSVVPPYEVNQPPRPRAAGEPLMVGDEPPASPSLRQGSVEAIDVPGKPKAKRTIADLTPEQQSALRQLREQNPQGGVTAAQIKAVVGGTKESVKALRDEVNTFPVYRPGGPQVMRGDEAAQSGLRQMPTSPTMQEYTSTTPQPARGWFMDPAGKPTLPPTPEPEFAPGGIRRQGAEQPSLTQMRRPYTMEGVPDEVQMQGQGRTEEVAQVGTAPPQYAPTSTAATPTFSRPQTGVQRVTVGDQSLDIVKVADGYEVRTQSGMVADTFKKASEAKAWATQELADNARAMEQERGNIFTDETGAVMSPVEFARGISDLAKNLPEFISRPLNEYFKTYGNAPTALAAAQETRRGGEQANVYVAAQNAARMSLAAKREYGGVLPPEAMAALRGNQEALNALKPETRALIMEARQHLDSLQRDFLSNLDPESRTSRIVADSVGEYVNRSYHIFDLKTVSESARNKWLAEREKTPMWESVVTERMRTKGEGRVQAENEVRQELLNYATQGEFSPGITGRLGAQDISTLKKMKDISPEWRSLMGEITDPILNYERTQQKLTSLATGARFQNTVLEAGQQQGWLAPADKAKAGWRQISPDEARNMGPLAGMWAPREVADVINQSLRTVQKMEGWRAGLQRVNQGIKYMQTVGNLPVSAARQAPQGFLTVVQSGLNPMNLPQWGEAYKLAVYHAMHGTQMGAKRYNKKMDEQLKEFAGTGVLDSEVNIQSQVDSLARAGVDVTDQYFQNPLGLKQAKAASRIYMIPDNATKMYAFMQLKKQYKSYMDKQRMTPEQRSEFIATKVKDQFPTYQRNPRAIQMFQDIPLSNPFVSFMYQTVRTQGNVVKSAIDNARSNDPDLQRIAKKQIAGLLAANLGATQGIQMLTEAYFGVTEEDKKVLQDAKPWWSKYTPTAWLGKDLQGRIMAMDLAYSSTGPGTIVPLLALLNAPEGEKMAAAAEALSGAFFGLSPAIEAGGEALFGVNPRTGKQVSGPRASTSEQAMDRVNAVLGRAFTGIKTAEQGVAAFTTGEYKDRPISPASFMAKNLGFPTDIVDPVAELKYAARSWSGKWRPEYDKLIEAGEKRLDARKAINERRRDEFNVVADRIKAMVATGIKKSEIRKSLVQDGMSMQAATDLVMGRYRPWRPQE